MPSLRTNAPSASTIRIVNPNVCNKKPKRLETSVQQNKVLVIATPGFVPAVTAASLRGANAFVEFATTLDHIIKCLVDQKFNVCVLFEDNRNLDADYVIKLVNLFSLPSLPLLKIIVIPSTAGLKESIARSHIPINFLGADARPKAIADEVQKELKKITNRSVN